MSHKATLLKETSRLLGVLFKNRWRILQCLAPKFDFFFLGERFRKSLLRMKMTFFPNTLAWNIAPLFFHRLPVLLECVNTVGINICWFLLTDSKHGWHFVNKSDSLRFYVETQQSCSSSVTLWSGSALKLSKKFPKFVGDRFQENQNFNRITSSQSKVKVALKKSNKLRCRFRLSRHLPRVSLK